MVMGTLIAWVLVRDRFWGKRALDLIIDIPFAMPTIVAGLVLLALYGSQGPLGVEFENTRKAVFLAIAFVTLPFIVRTVQPVMEEMETDVEDAAASLGASRLTILRRVVLPTLVPAIFAGAALSFARGISEYGSLVLLSGNLPNRTEVTSYRMASLLEGGNRPAAAALATSCSWSRCWRSSCSTSCSEGWPAVASASTVVGSRSTVVTWVLRFVVVGYLVHAGRLADRPHRAEHLRQRPRRHAERAR